MDQFFDRFERLFKSWASPGGEEPTARPSRRSGDPDVDAAMDELDDFLSAARGDEEAAERERARRKAADDSRKRAEEAARARTSTGSTSRAGSDGRDQRLVAAYEYLGLPYGTDFEASKAKYKKLLLKHHPDRHAGNPENIKKATETSARINEAWRIVEAWATTGRVPD